MEVQRRYELLNACESTSQITCYDFSVVLWSKRKTFKRDLFGVAYPGKTDKTLSYWWKPPLPITHLTVLSKLAGLPFFCELSSTTVRIPWPSSSSRRRSVEWNQYCRFTAAVLGMFLRCTIGVDGIRSKVIQRSYKHRMVRKSLRRGFMLLRFMKMSLAGGNSTMVSPRGSYHGYQN